MKEFEIFKPNTKEDAVWRMHYDGLSIPQISKKMRMPYDEVKEIILYGFRCLG